MPPIYSDYLIVENIAARLRTVLGSSVKVFDTMPFAPTAEEFDSLLVTTIEQANLVYFWVVTLNSLDPQPFATRTQRESLGIQALAYMTMSDKPGVPAADPGIANAFYAGTATGGSATTLVDSGAPFTAGQLDTGSHELWVTYSDGALDHRRIAGSTTTTLTVRQAFGTAIASGVTYEVWLRPTYWLLWENVRSALDALTQHRSAGGTAVTGNLPGFVVEPITLYERGFWRATAAITRDLFPGKTYQ